MTARHFFCNSTARLKSAAAAIAAMPASSARPLEVLVRPPRREKNSDQRKLFHAICADAAPQLGLTPNETKHMLKCEFYGVEQRVIAGRTYAFVQSSEDSDKDEYSRFIDFAYQFLAEQGITVVKRTGEE